MNIGYNPHLGYETDILRDYKNAVHAIAQKFRGSLNAGIDYEDLISVGNMGLLQAFRNYDPDRFDGKVTSFSTYAFPMIKWSIQRFLREKRYSVRVPRRIMDGMATILKQGWENETAEHIADISGWSVRQAREAKEFLEGWSVASLDSTVSISGTNGDEVALIELLPSSADFSEIDVQDFLSCLDHKEQLILSCRLNGLTQSEISEKVGTSQAHVSRTIIKIGEKYHKYQSGELKKEASIVARPRKELMTELPTTSGIEWFVAEAVPTNPTVGINSTGIHFNRRAVHETGFKPGQCLQVGFDASENRLIMRSAANGVLLKKVSGDTNGALRLVNKSLSHWLQSKGLSLKRYALHSDQNGLYYIDFSA